MRHIAGRLKAWLVITNEIVIEMIVAIAMINVCLAIIGSIISGEVLRFSLGVLLGTVYAVFIVVYMAKNIETVLELPESEAPKYAKKGYFVRYFAAIAVMIIGLKLEAFHFAGVFLAMMSVKLSVWVRPLAQKIIKGKLGKGR